MLANSSAIKLARVVPKGDQQLAPLVAVRGARIARVKLLIYLQ